ncbi:hypothetical protein P3T76_015148 [Phytophthora citrophthora]|uniref:Uncharacterized protein n=1 Tax=Phytophthora citrophthora TaxID=4793 RepID=A0AAD9G071_9STRA|nr:hypothetical protein P3T76_015148 [Phytophthora citrophthora]
MNNLLRVAASGGYINVSSYLCDEGAVDTNGNVILAAVQHGHTAVTPDMKQRYRSVVYQAVTGGFGEILALLHKSDSSRDLSPGCTTGAMDGAAMEGHLEVIKWLHENRTEGCTGKAIQLAVMNGHLRTARWLTNHYPHLLPRNAHFKPNDFDMLLFLQKYHPQACIDEVKLLIRKGGSHFMPASELSVVSFVLRRHSSAGALQHLGPSISSFLGPSPHLPFY